jgi:hypothetical protein
MDLYQTITPKQKDSLYVLEKRIAKCDCPINLGVFEELETALHALDFCFKFRGHDLCVSD